MADHRPVFSARVYEAAQAVGLVGFFGFFAACGMSIPLGWDWEWSIALAVFAVGSLVGSKAAQEFAGELRRDKTVAHIDPSEDLFSRE